MVRFPHLMHISVNISGAFQLKNFYIDVSNNSNGSSSQICAFEDQPFLSSETKVYICRNYLKGRYVRIRYPSYYRLQLHLCEVQVQGMERSFHKVTCMMMRSNHYEAFKFFFQKSLSNWSNSSN